MLIIFFLFSEQNQDDDDIEEIKAEVVKVKENPVNDPGWDSNYNPWGSESLTTNADEASNKNDKKEDETSAKKIKSHISKKEKKQLDKLEAIAIERAEQRVIDGKDLAPENVDEFDKLVLTSPDSSLCWIQYIAFHMEKKEYSLARAVVKRALEKINFREEKERFNIYMAWFNLENNFGTEDDTNKVFKEALQCNDEYKVRFFFLLFVLPSFRYNVNPKAIVTLFQSFHCNNSARNP